MDSKLKQKNKDRRKQVVEENQDYDDDEAEKMEIEPISINKKMQKQEMTNEGEKLDDEDVDVELLFFDPNENQQSSVKLLVNGYLDGMSFRSSEMAELIVKQVQIGTMVGCEDDDEDEPEYKKQYKEQNVYGFVTIINIGQHQNNPVMKEILKYTIEKSQTYNRAENHKILHELLLNKSKKVGLFLNERILNLAPQVVPVLHNQLLEDTTWLKKEDQQEWQNYDFDYLLVHTKTYKDQKATNQKKPKQKGDLALNEIIYQKFEDFIFMQKCEFYFSFEAHSSKSSGGLTNQQEKDYNDEVCYRVIYLIKASDYYKCIPEISKQIEQQ